MVLVHLSGQMLHGQREREYSLETPMSTIISDFVSKEADRADYGFSHNNKFYEVTAGELKDILGIKPHHSVKIIRRKRALQTEPKNYAMLNAEKWRACQKIIKKMEHYLASQVSKNDYIPKLIQEYPVLKSEPDTLAVLSDRQLIASTLASPEAMKNVHPCFVEIVYYFVLNYRKHHAQHQEMYRAVQDDDDEYDDYMDDSASSSSAGSSISQNRARPAQQPHFGQQNITMEMLQNAIFQSINPQGNQIPVAPVAPMPQPAQLYTAQLAQLHEFGFTDDEQNMQALVMTDGNVEDALQVIIALRESSD